MKMSGKLEGLVALVTGASSGIGKSTAITFAKEGAKVVVAARREDKLKEVVDEIKAAGGEAVFVVGDVSKEDSCKKMVDTAIESFGALHVAFNNAGIFKTALFSELEEGTLDDVLNVNTKSVAWCLKYQIPAMGKTAGGKGSIIINTSATALRPTTGPVGTGAGIYVASKAAAEMMMKYGAIEGAASNVRVNSIAPGHVETPIYGAPKESLNDILTSITAGTQLIPRPIQSDEVAKLAVFLASSDASMITGSTYALDGGWSIKA